MKTRILLVDDQNLVKLGICSLLELSERFEVVDQLDDGTEVISSINQYKPDIILLDIRMPKMDGLAVLAALKENSISTPVLILTTFDEHDLLLKCMKLGAKGYLRKDVSLQVLNEAIDTVAAGGLWIQPAVTNQVLNNKPMIKDEPGSMMEPLTQGEVQVLRLVAAGYSNNEIAEALHKSKGTIRNLMSFILSKLQVRDRTRAVLKAMEHGLI